jgi:glyoxylase-like metal-dependent hydrolase (beta-lactamase superfamily II)
VKGLRRRVAVSVQVQAIESMPFAENSYLVSRDGSADCVVVDPGFEPDLILDAVRTQKLRVVAILNTHGHVDHIAGNRAMKAAFPDAPLVIGRGDAGMLTDPRLNLSAAFGFDVTSPPADRLVDEGEAVEYAGLRFEVLEIPGHSPGHVVFVLRDAGLVLGGDVLFSGSIGRTDFPGGSRSQLVSGIRAKLWPLPDDTRVYPGHGPDTTIGEEKQSNPYVQ